jgi:RNA polymerase sporulation-specific sigma factor
MFFELAGLTLSHFLFLCLRVMTSAGFPPPLDKAHEEKLFFEMRAGSQKAREKLIEHNLRLVAHIIKKYDTDKNEQEDLISVGTIGLIKAIDSFDCKLGNRFATYAGKCVQNEILMYFRNQKKFASETSLNETIEVDKDGNPLTVLDVMRVEDDVVDAVHQKSRIGLALHALECVLSERERKVIILRYGLGGNRAHTQKQVAVVLGISRSYVSRIEKSALDQLRAFLEKPRNYI